jgi:hypothetical protein
MKVKNLFENKITKVGKYTVETWWDSRSKNHITQIKDKNDYQIGDSELSGNKADAEIDHKRMVEKAKELKEHMLFESENIIKIIESDFNRKRRKRLGYNRIIVLNAKQFKEDWEKQEGEKLDWNSNRLENLKNLNSFDSYPFVEYSRNKLGVSDGRHRIATTAYRGMYIEVALPTNHILPDKYKMSKARWD